MSSRKTPSTQEPLDGPNTRSRQARRSLNVTPEQQEPIVPQVS